MTHRLVFLLGIGGVVVGCSSTPAPAPLPTPSCATPPPAAPVASAPSGTNDASAVVAFDPAPWLEDLAALVDAFAAHYANLDYAIGPRQMDLAALEQRIAARIKASTNEEQVKRAFRAFLRAFGDAHLDIDWAATASASDTKTGSLCGRLGYAPRDPGGVDFTRAGTFVRATDADANDIPGGVLTLPGGHKLGILRIGQFLPNDHPKLCEDARVALKLADDAACDDACSDRVELEVSNRLTAAVERRATSLAAAGVAAVAVDLTGNGGGTNWVEAAVRVLTPVHLHESVVGVVRHEHWVKQLGEGLHNLETDLAAHGDLPNKAIANAIDVLKAEIDEVKTPCDKRPLFQAGQPKPSCSQLVRIHPSMGYAKPGELVGHTSAETLFGPSRYSYHEGVIALPLVVLVDGGTASAAEDFAEILQDQRAAVIVGSVTVGAGCGFTNGGIPAVLPRSGAHARIPDCARFRDDGTDAVAGVTPDVILPLLDRDSPYQRAKKIVAGLTTAWPTLVAPVGRGRR